MLTDTLQVGKEIQAHLRDSNGANGMSDGTLPVKTLENWRKSVKKAQQDVLQLVVAGSTASSTSVPHIFARIGLEPADKSTRKTCLSVLAINPVLTQNYRKCSTQHSNASRSADSVGG